VQFIDEIKKSIKLCLSKEIGVKVNGERFFDHKKTASYPIKVVVFNNKSLLGYFDPNFYEVGFHECLMHSSKEQLHNVIRHELAHYFTFIHHGELFQPHPPQFREFCRQIGWGDEVSRATFCLQGNENYSELEESGILRKIKKLMALAESSNPHEAEQAMIKSQQLLLKHNIEASYLSSNDDQKVFLKRILKQKRETAKMRAIAQILATFFVSTVFHRGGDFIYLEILGTSVNLEIAEYVANFLDSELDELWKQAQKLAKLKGMIAKNSFLLGIAKGYCNKIEALKREYTNEIKNALMVIEQELSDAKDMAYQRLTWSKSSRKHCGTSSALGELMGKQLNINPAINRSSSSRLPLQWIHSDS